MTVDAPSLYTPEWYAWWEHHHAKAKIDHYYNTHKKEIRWGDEYVAPPQAKGCWLEIKMVEDESDKGTFHETWDFNRKMPNRVTERIMIDVRAILDILCDEPGIHTPYAIQIDEVGKCHLVMAGWKGSPKVMDTILRNGTLEWVKTGVE